MQNRAPVLPGEVLLLDLTCCCVSASGSGLAGVILQQQQQQQLASFSHSFAEDSTTAIEANRRAELLLYGW